MTRSKLVGTAVVVGALALSACGADDGNAADGATTTAVGAAAEQGPGAGTVTTLADGSEGTQVIEETEPPEEVTGGTVGRAYPGDSYPPALGNIISLAITDLATSLGVDETAVAVILVEEVTWSDAGLGCPQPGMRYPQVQVDGLRIILDVNGVLYDYRSGGLQDIMLCRPVPTSKDGDPGVYEITEEGSVITVVPPSGGDEGVPTEGHHPPDK
jgi:hypothetical protein